VQNNVLRVAYKSRVGSVCGKPKLNNQDSFIIKASLQNIRGHYLFSILDGHGSYGHQVSQFIRDKYPSLLEDHLDYDLSTISLEKNIHHSVRDLCKSLQDSGIEIAFSGSTFLSVFILGSLCICANVGDSRAVLGRFNGTWEAIALSQDHNTKRLDERTRIVNSKGRVAQLRNEDGIFEGPERVWLMDEDYPGLAMTRSIGDKISKAVGVISDPEVIFRRLCPEDKFIILASDGVWEHIDSQEAVGIVSKYFDDNREDDVALALVAEAAKKWNKDEYVDDITVVVVFLNGNTE
jgi:serine/threonine protein phosphatase PrpC